MFHVALFTLVLASSVGGYLLRYWRRGRAQSTPPDHRLPSGKEVIYEFYEPPGSGLGYILAHMRAYEPALLDRLKIQRRTTRLDGKYRERHPTWDELFMDLTSPTDEDVEAFVHAFFRVIRTHGVWKCTSAFGLRLEKIGRFSLNESDRVMVRRMVGLLGEASDQTVREDPSTLMGSRDFLNEGTTLCMVHADEERIVGVLVPEAWVGKVHYRRILIKG